ncbi:MAG: hypothetical protein ABGY75_08950 [Gemmataceae bacterium]
MPVVSCQQCRADLDLDAADVGHLVECPACLFKFVVRYGAAPANPEREREAPLPDPESRDRQGAGVVDPRSLAVAAHELSPEQAASAAEAAPPAESVVVECTSCRGQVAVAPADLGHRMQCPLCDGIFTARDPSAPTPEPSWRSSRDRADDRPSRRRRRALAADEYDVDPSPQAVVRRAQSHLATPGGGLQVLGWIDVSVGVISLILGIVIIAADLNSGGGGGSWQLGLMNAGPGLSGVILGGLKAFGGAAMKQARNRSLSVLAAVAGCIPLNISCCMVWLMFPAYIVSVVFGIMALAALFKPHVKQAFEITRPGGDADGL